MTARDDDRRAALLLEHLKSRRWFGDRSRDPRGAVVRDEIPLDWPNTPTPGRHAVLRLDVGTSAGTSTYQLFADRAAGDGIVDALEDESFRRALVDGFARNLSFAHGASRWELRAEGTRPFLLPPDAPIRLSAAEQSNTSILAGDAAILKVFRRLERGVHPDVEVTRFLTIERQFVNVPVLLGTIRFHDPEGETIAGMLQELVPGAVDGWRHALDVSRAWLTGRDAADDPPFEGDARRLGTITRALHEALASGAPGTPFSARPATAADLRDSLAQALAMMQRAAGSLRDALTAGRVPAPHRQLAQLVASRADALRDGVPRMLDALGDDRGQLARTHGDYHLGQVIRSSSGEFFVIDFEGEPARPLAERRAHQSPLRDVAGMLRSFAYAAAVGSAEVPERGGRAAVWEARSRAAFMDGYIAAGDPGTRIVPAERAHTEILIALFETEKVFYELQYELDHRPDWVWVPLEGIARLAT